MEEVRKPLASRNALADETDTSKSARVEACL